MLPFFFEKKLTFSWGKISDLSHSTDPIHAMNGLKRDFPFINHIFRKYCVIPATQNADERLFSMVARNTGPLCRSIKISTIEKKVVVGKAIANHGFRFHFNGANASSSGDELDSF